MGIPFVMIMLAPSLGPDCATTTCEPLPPGGLACRGFVLLSMFWLPVLAVLALWSRTALVLLAIGGLLVAGLTAVMTSPLSGALAPLGLDDMPVFAQVGLSALLAGLVALWDLRAANRESQSRAWK